VVTLGNEASVVAGPRTSPGKLAPSAESFSPVLLRLGAEAYFWALETTSIQPAGLSTRLASYRGDICPSALPFKFAETRRLQRVRCFAEAPGVLCRPSGLELLAALAGTSLTGL